MGCRVLVPTFFETGWVEADTEAWRVNYYTELRDSETYERDSTVWPMHVSSTDLGMPRCPRRWWWVGRGSRNAVWWYNCVTSLDGPLL